MDIDSHVQQADITSDREVNLGKLGPGDPPSHNFSIRNTTGTAFKVVSVRKSCGCQTADIAEGTTVEPGGQLNFSYSLPIYGSGLQTGHLTITTDSPIKQFQEIEVVLRAQLPRKIWTTPDTLRFDSRTNEITADVVVESELPGLLDSFQAVDTCRNLVKVQLGERTPSRMKFHVSLDESAPDGDAFDYIVFRFTDPRYSLHTLSVRSHKEGISAPSVRTLTMRDVE